jgi:hypothetical protein
MNKFKVAVDTDGGAPSLTVIKKDQSYTSSGLVDKRFPYWWNHYIVHGCG